MAAITGDIEVRALLLELATLAAGATALAEITPAPAPPEATSLPPPQEAKAMTLETQIVIFLRIGSMINFLFKSSTIYAESPNSSMCLAELLGS
jgi:hypothetical protein